MLEWFKIGFGLSIGVVSALLVILLVLGLIETITTTIRFAFLRMKLKAGQTEGIVKE